MTLHRVDGSTSVFPRLPTNYSFSIIHNIINFSRPELHIDSPPLIPGNSTPPTTTSAFLSNSSLSWCHDLQGSDFIYTPTLYSPTIRRVIAVAFILVMVITVVGNAIVIIIVVTDRPLRRITSALVTSMAAADILVALCGELQSVIMMLSTDAWALSDVLCEVFTSADLYFSLSGLLHIVCLAGDRYLTICHPFKYERWGHKYMMASIIISWTLPVAFSFLPILVHWHRLGLEDLYACLHDLEVHVCTLFPNKGFSTVSFILMFALPSALMCYCYAHIYRVATAQRKRMSSVTLGAYTDVEDSSHVHLPLTCVLPAHCPRSPDSGYEETIFIQVQPQPDVIPATATTNNNYSDIIKNGDSPQLKKSLPVRKRRSRSLSGYRLGFLGEDFRAARSISLVFVCYTVTWTPYWITILIMPYLGPNEIPDPLIGACLWLAYFGSALNPFVYYFSNAAVKRGIRHLFHKVLHQLGHHNHTRSDSLR